MINRASLLAFALSIAHSNAQVYTNNGTVYTVTQDTGGDVALASKHFQYPYLPYQADSGDGPRGIQQGYNICNSSTAGPTSMCQTAFLNSIDDFCLWGNPTTNLTEVANVEEEMVAYCTSSKYGGRTLPANAIQGLQFIQTPGYVELVGYIDQTALGLEATDYGGEEDPHGADSRGNPLGSLLYTSAFGNGSHSQYQQVTEWSFFVGSGVFCFKACDPAGPNAASLCQHIYDRIGCTYNMPASYDQINGTFQSCKGENQLPPGVYVQGGQTMTYYQPPESDGPITSIPYTPAIPATSQCSTLTSANLFTGLTTLSTAAPTTSTIATVSAASSGAAQVAARSSSGASPAFQLGLASFALALMGGAAVLVF